MSNPADFKATGSISTPEARMPSLEGASMTVYFRISAAR
jgi:hypothetical protein